MSAEEACNAAAMATKEASPGAETVEIPLSDGGEGLLNCVKSMLDVNIVTIDAHDPLMNDMKARYAISTDGETAYMEMAETSGLTLVPVDKRNPLLTTTYGVGDMIADAIRRGCKQIIMGIGGSATSEGGAGMIQSLKDKGLLDKDGKISNDSLANCTFTIACDVNNPLYGKNGAAYIYGPQKGATPEQVEELDKRLRKMSHQLESSGVAKPEDVLTPGAGAAGGLGYGLMVFFHATLKRGIDLVLDINHFDERVQDSDLIITGEGKSDLQSLMGKVPDGVLSRAKKLGITTMIVSGAIDAKEQLIAAGFADVVSINEDDSRPLSELMKTDVAIANMKKTIRHYLRCTYWQRTVSLQNEHTLEFRDKITFNTEE